ncbi:MAG TPA: cob(I)yrinic acid a,c-diamide adenosyltransferase [Opitutaceae bacterium]|nr:cob(I)yrinic acid a,c-diamide adenosyltransferase [Opitutaceae bacterium]
MSIATRTGDKGTTGLLNGQRVPKDHPQIEAVGAFDELNVEVGAARLASPDPAVREALLSVQGSLVALMGELACAESDVEKYEKSKFARLTEADLDRLDQLVASLEAKGLKFDGWATPGGNPRALAFDRARVTARRAERSLAALPPSGRTVRPLLQQWTNRLSDVLWLLAREAEDS